MEITYLFVLDYAYDEAYQIGLSKKDMELYNNYGDNEMWWDEYRHQHGFSNNCIWMMSDSPINLCVNDDDKDTTERRKSLKTL